MIDAERYTQSFGFQWNQFKRTQFDSYTKLPISENRLKRVLGPLWQQIGNFDILECGCGAGRFTEVLLPRVKYLVSVDSSEAAEINRNLFISTHHEVLQDDILKLKNHLGKYDLVLAMGMIQHTPSPEETISRILDYVKPNGYLVFDHYTFKLSYVSLRLFYRQIFKRLPKPMSFNILSSLSKVFLPIHKKIKNNKFLKLILNRFSPFITYYDVHPDLNGDLQDEWALLDTFDSLTDHYKHFRNRNEIKSHLDKLNVEVLRCEYGGNGVEVICKKRS